jgi:hypothetical protein
MALLVSPLPLPPTTIFGLPRSIIGWSNSGRHTDLGEQILLSDPLELWVQSMAVDVPLQYLQPHELGCTELCIPEIHFLQARNQILN